MEVYHIGSPKYSALLTGEGAKLHGGRWNNIGTPCIYTSESIALCVLEYAANVSIEQMPSLLSVTVYTIPDKSWKEFKLEDLPQNWQEVPPPVETKLFGSHLLNEAKHFAFKLPSAVIPSEHNYILNTLHSDFKKIKIKEILPFTFDSRIKT